MQDFNVNYFVSLSETLRDNNCYQLSNEAKQALASKLIIHAKESYRAGFITSAKEGFKLALSIDKRGNLEEGFIYHTMRKILGYNLAERLIGLSN